MLACGGQVNMPRENSTGPATSATPAATRRAAPVPDGCSTATEPAEEAAAEAAGTVTVVMTDPSFVVVPRRAGPPPGGDIQNARKSRSQRGSAARHRRDVRPTTDRDDPRGRPTADPPAAVRQLPSTHAPTLAARAASRSLDRRSCDGTPRDER